MNNINEFIPIREASKLTGICPQTLRKLSDENKIASYKTLSGQRKFERKGLEKMCNIGRKGKAIFIRSPSNSANTSPLRALTPYHTPPRKNFIYVRVSSNAQLEDLTKQIEHIKAYCPEYASYTVISDISTGINFRRKGLSTILDACIANNIGEIVTIHKDKLSRFAFDLINQIVEKAGGKITVVDEKYENQYIEQELSDDFLSIAKVYCKKIN
jgi:putative resolvase